MVTQRQATSADQPGLGLPEDQLQNILFTIFSQPLVRAPAVDIGRRGSFSDDAKLRIFIEETHLAGESSPDISPNP